MVYDTIIIGGGPAGMAAAIYATRYKLSSLVIAHDFGQISKAPCIENYPGVEKPSGMELITKFRDQAKEHGAEIKTSTITSIEKKEDLFELTAKEGEKYQAKTVILAMGAAHRRLHIENEDKFVGKGVSYCSTCDAPLFSGKKVAVVGGGDSAAVSALHIAGIASEVTLIYRGDALKAQPSLIHNIESKENIRVITNANVEELKGDTFLSGAKLDNGEELEISGLFIEIGQIPSTDLARNAGIELDKSNYIQVNKAQMTNIPGVFAAGDITDASNNLKQILTAAAQGAVAANAAFKFINQ